ncbi:MAG: hypothetical protein GTO45_29045 [Candidatus Aminicenantes bacterium]|nr:hypothetical protein [Candidatus Aminicenantes bacterium]NIM82839.1 hypothetical protein [Candidatus Aminicenantes bacterium]NIN22215.1 hypothetical protein [Candidatus Aminicenantes bacterium]NIN45983.1 hypothetical protein [Candidatus Aminicenantes bacterium]NIN88819.1 hypothetical protein [Candidatus Aminicenantes bacterium]
MKYYHVAGESEVDKIYNNGIYANDRNEIILVVLKDDFLLKKFVLDMYAYEELGVDTYCAFEISPAGVEGPLFETNIKSMFSGSYKASKQPHIESQYIKPFKGEESYEGMGLIDGVFPVENKDKFTDEYKHQVLEYLQEVGS